METEIVYSFLVSGRDEIELQSSSFYLQGWVPFEQEGSDYGTLKECLGSAWEAEPSPFLWIWCLFFANMLELKLGVGAGC